jgi:DNA polymerase-1
MARIFLVDTMFHIYRAYHALPPMYGPEGVPTSVVRGVIGILSNLWKSERMTHLACVFEPLDAGFRAEIDPNYKAHRPEVPVDLAAQIPLVREACECLGIATYDWENFEADDVLASLAFQAVQQGHQVVIVSNDKDLAQLCRYPEVSILRIKGQGKNAQLEYVDQEKVPQLFGVGPELIPSWLALNGDAVDNIPGIPGIGPKTAVKLLHQLGPLPQLLERASEAGRFAPSIAEHAEQLLRNLDLATLRHELPLEFSLEKLCPQDFRGLLEFFRRLGLKRYLEALEGGLFQPNNVRELWS